VRWLDGDSAEVHLVHRGARVGDRVRAGSVPKICCISPGLIADNDLAGVRSVRPKHGSRKSSPIHVRTKSGVVSDISRDATGAVGSGWAVAGQLHSRRDSAASRRRPRVHSLENRRKSSRVAACAGVCRRRRNVPRAVRRDSGRALVRLVTAMNHLQVWRAVRSVVSS
jgi:hypothetical protein